MDIDRRRETVLAEPGAEAPEADAASAALAFERLPALTGMAGHVQVARIGPDGMSAGSDPRADGGVLVV
jgi:hypothetical protein